jgi:hypothetical protein
LAANSVLYYSPDDVNKFQFLLRMQHDNVKSKGDEKAARRNLERKLEQLQAMKEYCTKPKCRRNTLVQHFGGKPVDCRKTCDYCSNPKKVEQALNASTATKDTRIHMRHQRKGFQKDGVHAWDGQWERPHDDDVSESEDAMANDWIDGTKVGELRVTGPLEVDPGDDLPSGPQVGRGSGFAKASDILSRYESMEDQASKYKRSSFNSVQTTRTSINIPPHLAASLAAASSKSIADKPGKLKQNNLTSNDHANNVEEIKQKLEKLKKEREARLNALQEKKAKGPPPPPPPVLTFGRPKR